MTCANTHTLQSISSMGAKKPQKPKVFGVKVRIRCTLARPKSVPPANLTVVGKGKGVRALKIKRFAWF